MITRIAAWISLAVCLAVPFLFFWGWMGANDYKIVLAVASLGWFVLGTRALMRKSDAQL